VLSASGAFEGEKLLDIAVSPSGARAVVLTTVVAGGRTQARLRWVDADGMGPPQTLSMAPVSDSLVWRPDERAVAMVVHAVALGSVVQAGPEPEDAAYFGDLVADGTPGPPVAPLSWSPDLGRVVFGGIQGSPALDGAGQPLELPLPVMAPQTKFGLLISDGSGLPATPFGAGGMSPAWLPDGRLLALGNQVVPGGGSDLLLRLVDRDGTVTPLEKLGVRVSGPTTYAARWDVPHRRLLVLVNRPDADLGVRDVYLASY
jgi:hypothetical protein